MTKLMCSVLLVLFLSFSMLVTGQSRLAEFQFNDHLRPVNVNTSIGFGQFNLKVSSPDVVIEEPTIKTEQDEVTKAMFFQFQAFYSVANNNVNIALAPKAGRNVRITHIEFRIRFDSNRDGNAGIFISKDPETKINTQIWTCGNNKAFNTYKDFVVVIPDSEVNYSESETDSIRFVFGHGTNTKGMYLDDFVIYGVVNDETNTSVVNISLDASKTTHELADRPSGANACWLMDSDINWPRDVSNEERFAEMKLGALRFPYGHLADNYLWHTPGDYSNLSVTGPIAQVASPSIPAKWDWAVNQTDGTFLKAMGFDEFIAVCKRQGIEPFIVINAASYTYNGGPTYETLKQSAVEWVRYANITKNYGVKYWQIGNEVEHKNAFTMDAYTNLFIDFATAMKAIDPTIKVGTGVLNNNNWNKNVLTKAGNLCDFISNHQYQWTELPTGGFRMWHKDNSILVSNTQSAQTLLNRDFLNRPELEIHVTETNVTGIGFPDQDIIDLYKALYWFEMNMNHLSFKNVKYTYYWGTHSPWGGETDPGGVSTLLENSNANTVRPAGKVIQLINENIKKRWVDVTRVHGNVRSYATVSDDGNKMSVFVLNKNLYPEKINLNISNYNIGGSVVEKIVFTGNHFNDTDPQITKESLDSSPDQLTLDPLSITILNYEMDDNTLISSIKKDLLGLFYEKGFVNISKPQTERGVLKVYTLDGRKMIEKHIEAGSNRVKIEIISSGVHIVSVEIGDLKERVKIIK